MQTNSAFMLSFFCVNFSRQELTLLNTAQNTIKIAFLKSFGTVKRLF